MSDWKSFCRALDLGAVVSDQLARYRPAIADGMAFFLDKLSPARTFAMLAEQASMPDDTAIEERLVAIAHHCPALHKLGQVLARDRRLPLPFRRQLQRLETMEPAQEMSWIRAELERELGSLSKLGVELAPTPLAEASVSVVIPFETLQLSPDQPRRGVFKLLKPGVEDNLREELRLLRKVGAFLDERCHHYRIPEISYEGTFKQVSELLSLEIHLDREQHNLRSAGDIYRPMRSVVVPRVFPFSTPRVTAMERVDGCKVTDVGAMSDRNRLRLAGVIAEALIARPIWSNDPSTMFHADPHAGNLIAMPDGRLAILDWSLVGHLRKRDKIGLAQIVLGAATLDARRIGDQIRMLSETPVKERELRDLVDGSLAPIRGGNWPGLTWLTRIMDEAVKTAGVQFHGDFLAFRKVLQTLNGVIADVSEECEANTVLAVVFLRHLSLECGLRTIAPAFSRDFGTHLSNADLTQLLASLPLTLWQQWLNRLAAGAADSASTVRSDQQT